MMTFLSTLLFRCEPCESSEQLEQIETIPFDKTNAHKHINTEIVKAMKRNTNDMLNEFHEYDVLKSSSTEHLTSMINHHTSLCHNFLIKPHRFY